jgi:GGDEF domain-containing protein
MSLNNAVPVMSPVPAGPALVLIVGDSAAAHQIAPGLQSAGVATVSAASGRDALERVTDLAPDLVVVGKDETHEPAVGDVIRQLRARPGKRPRLVVIGHPGLDGNDPAVSGDGQTQAGEDYFPADVGVAELVDHIRAKLNQPSGPAVASRPAVPQQRLDEEIERELQRAELAKRPGMLAAVTVAELGRLHQRLGAQAEQAVAVAFDELFAQDAQVLEQHSAHSGGGFWLLMPKTDLAPARARLERLARRVASTVLDVGGEQVRMTPVIGFTPFSRAASGRELRDQANLALEEARLHLDLIPVGFSIGQTNIGADPPLAAVAPESTTKEITMPGQRVVNLLVRGLLRTPGPAAIVGGRLAILYVVGRKSGRRYSVPVAMAARA